jgi:hypothetical protein
VRAAGGAAAVVAVAVAAAPARADVHGSVAAGGALLLTANDGDLQRADVEVEVEPGGSWGRYGALVALRAFDTSHDGLLCAGVVFDAAAARPTLLLQLHADLGVDLDLRRPLAGGGVRTTLGLAGPLAIVLDAAGYLVVDGYAGTRIALAADALVAVKW